jgi:hypothetical protein
LTYYGPLLIDQLLKTHHEQARSFFRTVASSCPPDGVRPKAAKSFRIRALMAYMLVTEKLEKDFISEIMVRIFFIFFP